MNKQYISPIIFKTKIQFFVIVAILILLNLNSKAQVTETVSKPKIGLVLSGGGAKGIAHVGVLKVLEEAGIKPDYITGTSMGSIVGAFYAMGYTADEISEINGNTDWSKLLSDRLVLNKIVMEEKYESKRYLFKFPIRNYKLKLPSGLIEGQHLESFFSEMLWPLTENENFDSLPIPFHCMSVDLISGQTIEHKSGDLVKSIRASMSIPSIFAPRIIDTLLLVDGGLTRNFAVQEVINMGADIVIGVYVGFHEDVSQEDLFSLTDVLSRSIVLAGVVDSKSQSEKVDILITPDLHGLGTSDFSKANRIEQYGEDEARKYMDDLKALVKRYDLDFRKVPSVKKPDKILITNIKVEELRFLSKEFLIGQSGLQIGDSVSFTDIKKAIEKINGTQYFAKVTYSLQKDEDDYTIVFDAKEKTRAHLNLAPFYNHQRGVGLTTNLTLQNYAIKSSHLVFTLNIAENPGLRFELTKLWGKKQRLMNFYYVNGNKDELPYLVDGKNLGNYNRISWVQGVGMRYSFGLNRQIGVKGFYEYQKLQPNNNLTNIIYDTPIEYYKSQGFGSSVYYEANTTDDLYFPKKGIKYKLRYTYSFNPSVQIKADSINLIPEDGLNLDQNPNNNLYCNIDIYKTLLKRITLNLGATSGINTNNNNINGNFLLGGMHADKRIYYQTFAGFTFGELVSNNFAKAHANVNIKLYQGLYLSIHSNVGYINDNLDNFFSYFSDYSGETFYAGYSAGIKFDSPIGPMRLMVGDNNRDEDARLYFSIGYPF